MAGSSMSDVVQHLRRAVLVGEGAEASDGQLLERFVRRREASALAGLVERHGPMVWGVCRRVLADYHDAEDAFQATFLVLVRRAASIVPRHMVGNWLYGVAHQTARKARATSARRRLNEKQVSPMPEAAMAERDAARDLQEVLDRELAGLPDAYRVTIVLCDLEGKTRREAAQELGWPEGTVASRHARARSLLARRLARQGLAVTGAALAAELATQAAVSATPSIHAAGLLAASEVSQRAALLAEGVVKTMLLCKLKKAIGVLSIVLLVGALGTGWGLLPAPSAGGDVTAVVGPHAPDSDAVADEATVQAGDRKPPGKVGPPGPTAPIDRFAEPPPLPDGDAEEMLALILKNCAQALTRLDRCSAVIRRTSKDHALDRTDVYEGTFRFYRRTAGQPGQAVLELANSKDPSKIEKLIFTGTQVHEYHSPTKTIRVHELPRPLGSQTDTGSSLLAHLTGMTLADHRERYRIAWVPAPQEERQRFYHYLEITPKLAEDRRTFTRARLAISAGDFLPRQLWYLEPDGNEKTLDFKLTDDRSLRAEMFAPPQPPPGWKIQHVNVPLPGSSDAVAQDRNDPKPPTGQRQPGSADATDQIVPGDRLQVHVNGTLPDQPIHGVFRVEPAGTVPFGFAYGRVSVKGLTPEQAEKRIGEHLSRLLKDPQVRVTRYDAVAHGQDPALERRVQELEEEVRELRAAIRKLMKERQ
jgi:TIGR03009 family protein